MERFYIITNTLKDKDYKITQEIQTYIEQNGGECILSEKDGDGHILPESIPKDVDCALVLGGDGTMIRAARELGEHSIPLLGINLGTLGYLAEVEVKDLKDALTFLLQGKPDIEERMMIEGTVEHVVKDVAINDIVLTRQGGLRIVQFAVYVNGILLNTYLADGLIISTPTGSTGYNLSAGGPVVEPTASIFVLTPICSHALNTSSIVLSAKDRIEIEVCRGRYGREEHVLLNFDGTDGIPLVTGNRVCIQKAKATTKLVKLSKESFMKTMRKKMKGN
ncbi:NAD(+)/NADH kinase [Faecalicatena acetigenes]|jgi:NAD+ kinase|uniref:NAD kinase n=1 Tax=Faecalicatena acetigenes TaxID=2981790 RepID=A0ABT2TEB5_9FIRM|nr:MULTISPECIES: NAD(+)/NADH kinase [Lachnospiraceae]MCU6748152.1 NAD(+)/NADH kinase [Faecalicatena acetigenes]RGT74418.1 NAD(+)/NADH kinase [Ruminococcus sp. AF18-22]SCI29165.1 Probable inorganic polyphosphate/ATP-NAD kinase [uncultured Clostridium sp.]